MLCCYEVLANDITKWRSGKSDRRYCVCTRCRTCTRCCLLAGTSEGSLVFTGLRQCAHPTNTLFLEPAWVSPLNSISISSAVFALPTHWSRPHRNRQISGDMSHVSDCRPIAPRASIVQSYIFKPPKVWKKSTLCIMHSISTVLHYNRSTIPVIKINTARDPSLSIVKLTL